MTLTFDIESFFVLFGPPDIVVGGLIFYQRFFLLSSFFRQLPAELAERNSTISSHMVEIKCDFKTHVHNLGYPSPHPTNRDPKITFFDDFATYRANLTAYIFGVKHDIHKQVIALQTIDKESPYTLSQNDMNFCPQTASNWK